MAEANNNLSFERFHLRPIDEINGFKVRPGLYEQNGATAIPSGVNFTVPTNSGTSVELLLFRNREDEPYAVIPFPETYRIGNVYSMIVFDLNIEEFEYAYRVDGPYDKEKGLIFDKNRILLDMYAKSVTGQSEWGKKRSSKSFYKARVVRNDFDWGSEPNPNIGLEDLVIYEMHVRGFTKDISSGVKYPGTFAGVMEKIPYLKDLGVNAVELMPIFEFDEIKDNRKYNDEILVDYWGYNPISFFAPNTSYAAKTEDNSSGTELKKLIKRLHDNGIECLLDVVFNHTAEGNELGPSISFKGFDNNVYYMLTPRGEYYNFSGCGNTLNCNHPVVRYMILECLRYWVTDYHVDGFRFDLASILGRNEDGSPMSNAPLLQNLAYDQILADVKLIAEAWDAGGLYQVGTFPSWNRWAEWNGKYRDDMRDFLKGDIGLMPVAARRIAGSKDIYNPEHRGENASVNFINCHDGFTLWDMYCYNHKHNEANGWNNTDGADDNRSWNCGWEGETDNEYINKLRYRLCKNAMTTLLMSRGTPMFLAGDEFLNTQYGNNNTYCQDSPISWLEWGQLEKNREHFRFTRHLIKFRNEHPVIRKYMGSCSLGFPDSWTLGPDHTNVLRAVFAGRNADNTADDIVCFAINTHWERQDCYLPELPHYLCWQIETDSSLEIYRSGFPDIRDKKVRTNGNLINMEARSTMVFSVVRV